MNLDVHVAFCRWTYRNIEKESKFLRLVLLAHQILQYRLLHDSPIAWAQGENDEMRVTLLAVGDDSKEPQRVLSRRCESMMLKL